ncbi:MAG TPA: CD225/dispanin family protein [Actinomadura sp.]|nr:CD225/dispanin family protein [Actinomadura sp.]
MSYGYGGGGYPPQGGGYPPQGGGYGGGYGSVPAGGGAPPPNHLVWAILSTIFCCQVPGIVSIVFSSQVNSKYQQGDYAGANDSSSKAKTWALVATGLGVAAWVFWILYIVFVGIAASSGPSSY